MGIGNRIVGLIIGVILIGCLSFCLVKGEGDSFDQQMPNEDIGNFMEEMEEKDVIVSSQHVSTSVLFPKSPNKEFLFGKKIDVLIAFSNSGNVPFNITSIQASLVHHQRFSLYVQNFSRSEPEGGLLVDSGESVSIYYGFMPDELLEPGPYGLTGTIDYYEVTADATNYTSVFFNGTANWIENFEGFDVSILFTYLLAAALLFLIGFLGFKALTSGKGRIRGTRFRFGGSKSTERGTQYHDDPSLNEWLQGTNAIPQARKRSKKYL